MPDFYELLGVSPSCSNEQLRQAYKEKVLECHPDKNQRPDAAETFRKVKEAFEVLGTTSSRLAYDQRRQERLAAEEQGRKEMEQREAHVRQQEEHARRKLRDRAFISTNFHKLAIASK